MRTTVVTNLTGLLWGLNKWVNGDKYLKHVTYVLMKCWLLLVSSTHIHTHYKHTPLYKVCTMVLMVNFFFDVELFNIKLYNSDHFSAIWFFFSTQKSFHVSTQKSSLFPTASFYAKVFYVISLPMTISVVSTTWTLNTNFPTYWAQTGPSLSVFLRKRLQKVNGQSVIGE